MIEPNGGSVDYRVDLRMRDSSRFNQVLYRLMQSERLPEGHEPPIGRKEVIELRIARTFTNLSTTPSCQTRFVIEMVKNLS
jgi:hypothetical protein